MPSALPKISTEFAISVIAVIAIFIGGLAWTIGHEGGKRLFQEETVPGEIDVPLKTVTNTKQNAEQNEPELTYEEQLRQQDSQVQSPGEFDAIANAKTKFDQCGKKEKYMKNIWWNDFANKTQQVDFYSENDKETQIRSGGPEKTRSLEEYCASRQDSDICINGGKKLSFDFEDGFEGCLSLDGSLFIAVFPGEFMGAGNHIFRYDVKNGVLEEARRIDEVWGDAWDPVPQIFLERTGNEIEMTGRDGDAGFGAESIFGYDFVKNEVRLKKTCTLGEGVNTCKTF